jgi:hypothetical protein
VSRYDWRETHPGITRPADAVNRGLTARYRLWDGMLAAVKVEG